MPTFPIFPNKLRLLNDEQLYKMKSIYKKHICREEEKLPRLRLDLYEEFDNIVKQTESVKITEIIIELMPVPNILILVDTNNPMIDKVATSKSIISQSENTIQMLLNKADDQLQDIQSLNIRVYWKFESNNNFMIFH
ncbi:MAG: hypothetical protein Sylvanvirus7_28 [Sylvanvirus sp.]|uniref:Uncharacterized protein n=1 Tax=Sylvanvirus sp. TaxID=2487774 RepID=A0A3G5AHT2_9VIRU|nr:MAG: hypothetical protein Sylvanvirus7_28 [Sylvanvirus sp.]